MCTLINCLATAPSSYVQLLLFCEALSGTKADRGDCGALMLLLECSTFQWPKLFRSWTHDLQLRCINLGNFRKLARCSFRDPTDATSHSARISITLIALQLQSPFKLSYSLHI